MVVSRLGTSPIASQSPGSRHEGKRKSLPVLPTTMFPDCGTLLNHAAALAAGTLYDFFMDFCDLIVSMGQAEISSRPVVGAIVVVCGLAVSFLLWLVYVHHASADFAGRWMFLPALNALLNGSCAVALCVGLYFIKHRNREAHRRSMLLAFAFSSVFLLSYIVNHALHGDTVFPGHGPVRTLYLSILASHVILSVVALPMVLTTFFFSLTGRFAMHRRIARFTFPIWLYVSITGVVVFVFLKAYVY